MTSALREPERDTAIIFSANPNSIAASATTATDPATNSSDQAASKKNRREDMNPAIGGGGRRKLMNTWSNPATTATAAPAAPPAPKTAEEIAKEKELEEERIERERRRKLLAGTGMGEIGTRLTEMLHVDFFANNVNLDFIGKSTEHLASLEEMARYKSWLRGALTFLSVFSFASSIVNIHLEKHSVNHYINMGFCLAGMYCVVLVYKIKAKQAGVSNPLYGNNSGSLLHSPYLLQMLCEIGCWSFTPPFKYVDEHMDWLSAIDFFSFLRLYNFALWLSNRRYANRTFCRVMSAISGIKLTTGFYMRTSMIYNKAKTSLVTITIGWCALALAYCKAEDRSFWDSFYCIFVTAGTIGYGDIYPVTVTGRVVCFIAWVFGLLILGWVVVIFQMHLNLTDHEKNLYILFRTNELSTAIRNDSARLIQRAFRIHMRNKLTKKHTVLTDIALWQMARLTRQLKKHRTEFKSHVQSYTQVMASGDNEGRGMMMPITSSLGNPLTRTQQIMKSIGGAGQLSFGSAVNITGGGMGVMGGMVGGVNSNGGGMMMMMNNHHNNHHNHGGHHHRNNSDHRNSPNIHNNSTSTAARPNSKNASFGNGGGDAAVPTDPTTLLPPPHINQGQNQQLSRNRQTSDIVATPQLSVANVPAMAPSSASTTTTTTPRAMATPPIGASAAFPASSTPFNVDHLHNSNRVGEIDNDASSILEEGEQNLAIIQQLTILLQASIEQQRVMDTKLGLIQRELDSMNNN